MYTDSGMGREEYTVFQEVAGKNGICLNGGLALPEDATDADIRTALAQLESSSGANVVVLFSKPDLSMRILQLAQQMGIADDFLWILAVDDPELVKFIPAGQTFQSVNVMLLSNIPSNYQVFFYTPQVKCVPLILSHTPQVRVCASSIVPHTSDQNVCL